jgi:hypothetical protein
MGNNQAFTAFEAIVMTLYDAGALTLEVLDSIAEQYRGTDIDSGGSMDLIAKDGKGIREVCVYTVEPNWKPEKNEYYMEKLAEDGEEQATFSALVDYWYDMKYDRWGWR